MPVTRLDFLRHNLVIALGEIKRMFGMHFDQDAGIW